MFETRPPGRARVRNGTHSTLGGHDEESAWPLDQWAGLRCRREDDLGPSFHRDAEGGCTGSIKSASRSPSPLDDEQPLGSWPPRQGRRASIDRPHSTTTSTRLPLSKSVRKVQHFLKQGEKILKIPPASGIDSNPDGSIKKALKEKRENER